FGRDIVFAAGEYVPASQGGRRLIAHELTHVLQQGQADEPHLARAPDSDTGPAPPDPRDLPSELDRGVAAEHGQAALAEVGYDELIRLAAKAGLLGGPAKGDTPDAAGPRTAEPPAPLIMPPA